MTLWRLWSRKRRLQKGQWPRAERFTLSRPSPQTGNWGAGWKAALGAGWAGRSVVTRKTRIYKTPPVGPGEKMSKFTKITSSQGYLHRLQSRQLYSWFSYLTSKLLFQQCFIIHFLQQFKGIRLGKKPQIIKEWRKNLKWINRVRKSWLLVLE